jgi:hypothetical protein
LLVPSRFQGAPCSRPRTASSSIWSLMTACNARSSRMLREARTPISSSCVWSTRLLTAATRRSSLLSAPLRGALDAPKRLFAASQDRHLAPLRRQARFLHQPVCPSSTRTHPDRHRLWRSWKETTGGSTQDLMPRAGPNRAQS